MQNFSEAILPTRQYEILPYCRKDIKKGITPKMMSGLMSALKKKNLIALDECDDGGETVGFTDEGLEALEALGEKVVK